MIYIHAYLSLLLLFVRESHAYSTGPPPNTCLTMFPKHGVEKQMGESPFSVTVNQSSYSPSHNLTVSIQSSKGRTFKGFQITAHRTSTSNNTQELIGTFIPSDNTSKTITCLGQAHKMIAHASAVNNRTSVSAIWIAPSFNVGDLQFYATVVEEKAIIWFQIKSEIIRASTDPKTSVTVPSFTIPQVSAVPAPFNWSDCGKDKGCLFVPEAGIRKCSGRDCKAALSYRKSGDQFSFEMSVKGQDSYISVGFSKDQLMGDDQTILCTGYPEWQSVQLGYNPSQRNERQYTMGLSNTSVSTIDGNMYCTFTRKVSLKSIKEDGSDTVFDIGSTPYYLFLAWGHVYIGTDSFAKHTEKPAISAAKVNMNLYSFVDIISGDTASNANHFAIGAGFYLLIILKQCIFVLYTL